MRSATLVSLAVLLASCGGGSSTPDWTADAAALPDGVTVLSTDSVNGIRGVVKQDGESVFFEARSVSMTEAEVEAGGEDGHQYKTDARFFDNKGRTFSLIVGGDGAMDPSWATDSPDAGQASATERARHFNLAATLAKVRTGEVRMSRLSASTRMAVASSPEWARLSDLSASSDGESEDGGSGRMGALSHGGPQALASAAVTYTHEIRAYKKATALWTGDHSSTWTRQIIPPSLTYKQIITCNHGTCANSSNITRYCTRTFPGRTTDIGSLLSASLDSFKGYCTTSYGLTSGKHVCNDDTRVQLAFIKNNGGASMAFCGDSTLARVAPTCP